LCQSYYIDEGGEWLHWINENKPHSFGLRKKYPQTANWHNSEHVEWLQKDQLKLDPKDKDFLSKEIGEYKALLCAVSVS
jgi:hypothetical protein